MAERAPFNILLMIIRQVQATTSLRGSYLFQLPCVIAEANFSYSTRLYGGVRSPYFSPHRLTDPATRRLTSLKVGIMLQEHQALLTNTPHSIIEEVRHWREVGENRRPRRIQESDRRKDEGDIYRVHWQSEV